MSPSPGCSPSFRQYVASARAGDVDALFLLESADADAVEVDVLLYKRAWPSELKASVIKVHRA
ncbi:hypothetical protein [Nocardia sp. NPDC050710]|uniref:hypothetical protein n=1 Tax=Nocardia sp. NPDC050710 TaxID=3157220 RepID=UPI0033F0B993